MLKSRFHPINYLNELVGSVFFNTKKKTEKGKKNPRPKSGTVFLKNRELSKK